MARRQSSTASLASMMGIDPPVPVTSANVGHSKSKHELEQGLLYGQLHSSNKVNSLTSYGDVDAQSVEVKCQRAADIMLRAAKATPSSEPSAFGLKITPPAMTRAEPEFTLFPYQLDGVGRLAELERSELKGAILGDEMGLGKTVELIALMLTNNVKSATLIVAPANLTKDWMTQLARFYQPEQIYFHNHDKHKTPTAAQIESYKAVVVSYEILRAEYKAFQTWKSAEGERAKSLTTDTNSFKWKVVPLMEANFGRTILEEGHMIRSGKATYLAVNALNSKYRIISTGTRLHKNYDDLLAYLGFLKIQPWVDPEFFRLIFTNVFSRRHRRLGGAPQVFIILTMEAITVARLQIHKFNKKPLFHLPPPDIRKHWLSLDKTKEISYWAKSDGPNTHEFNPRTEQETQDEVRPLWDPAIQLQKILGQETDQPPVPLKSMVLARMSVAQPGCHRATPQKEESKGEQKLLRELASFRIAKQDTEGPAGEEDESEDRNDDQEEDEEEKEKEEGEEPQNVLTAAEARAKWREEVHQSKIWNTSTKIQFTVELTETVLKQDRLGILIFVDFLGAVDSLVRALQHALQDQKTKVLVYQGSTSRDDRESLCKQFQAQTKTNRMVMVITDAGGTGLNLTMAQDVIMMTPHWTPSVDKQKYYRAHRVGQTVQVRVYEIYARDSIDVRIDQIRVEKDAMAEDFLEPLSEADPDLWTELQTYEQHDFIEELLEIYNSSGR